MTWAATTSITVRVPIAMRRRGGRKLIVTSDGGAVSDGATAQTRGDPILVKALARAHWWRRQLEDGWYRSLRELAAAEGVDRRYMGRLLQLTLLAPEIVEAALGERLPSHRLLPASAELLPVEWDRQAELVVRGA